MHGHKRSNRNNNVREFELIKPSQRYDLYVHVVIMLHSIMNFDVIG